MGCDCKKNKTMTGKTFVDRENIQGFKGTKTFFWLVTILSAPIVIPLTFILSIRSIILGKPIDIVKATTFFIPNKEKFILKDE